MERDAGVKLFLSFAQDSARFLIFELYRSEDGRAAHQQTAHFKAAIAELLPRVAERERVPFVPYATV